MAYGIHPSFDITESRDSSLRGKSIILCITGSVAAVRSSDLARLLMRKGAKVYPVMSESACKLIGPDLMEWACGFKPITTLTGAVEHVALAGNVEGKADLIMVAPCTANTIGKIAGGIDDTPVTTMVTTALGEHIPLIVVPAMHEPMYRHPFVIENIEKLKKAGITVMLPRVEEGKAKIPENTDIVNTVCSVLEGDKPLAGKKILITAGRTVEYIDPVRVITNNSTGKMGFALAEAARDMGAEVTVVYGKGSVDSVPGINIINADTACKMKKAVEDELASSEYDMMFAAAAVRTYRRQCVDALYNHFNGQQERRNEQDAMEKSLLAERDAVEELEKNLKEQMNIAKKQKVDIDHKIERIRQERFTNEPTLFP